jgi:hypothetical protein
MPVAGTKRGPARRMNSAAEKLAALLHSRRQVRADESPVFNV